VGGATLPSPAPADEMDVDTGFTGMWRRDVLVEAGGWDEASPYDEDAELAHRLRAQGGRYGCVASMAASCIARDARRTRGKQYWRYGTSTVRTFADHPEAMRPSHLLP